jgi:hypothetical protein
VRNAVRDRGRSGGGAAPVGDDDRVCDFVDDLRPICPLF